MNVLDFDGDGEVISGKRVDAFDDGIDADFHAGVCGNGERASH